jgi:hypothetical protein
MKRTSDHSAQEKSGAAPLSIAKRQALAVAQQAAREAAAARIAACRAGVDHSDALDAEKHPRKASEEKNDK